MSRGIIKTGTVINMKTIHKMFIVTLALVFVSAACVPALAAGKYTAYISGTGKASAGGTVECEIVMTDVAIFGGILAFSAAVGYDEDVLEFDSASSSASGVPEGWLTDIGNTRCR